MEFIFFSVLVVENVGKIEIVLKKKENTSWKCLGHPQENHNSFIPKKDTGRLCCYFESLVHENVCQWLSCTRIWRATLSEPKGPCISFCCYCC